MFEALDKYGKDNNLGNDLGKDLKKTFLNIANTKTNKDLTKADKDKELLTQYTHVKKLLQTGKSTLSTELEKITGVKADEVVAKKVQYVKNLLIKNPALENKNPTVTDTEGLFTNFDYAVLGGKDKVQAAHDEVDFGLHNEFLTKDKKFDRWTKHEMKLKDADDKHMFTPCLAYEYYTVKIDGANSEVKPTDKQVAPAKAALDAAIEAANKIKNPGSFATYLDKKFVGGDTAYYKSVDKARLMQGVITQDFFHVDRLATNLPGDVSNVVLQTYTPKNN